jgi:hypothetical protein
VDSILNCKDTIGSPCPKIKCPVYRGFRAKNLVFLKSGENRKKW